MTFKSLGYFLPCGNLLHDLLSNLVHQINNWKVFVILNPIIETFRDIIVNIINFTLFREF